MMTAAQYRQSVETLGLDLAKAGRFLRLTARTSRRYAVSGPPPHVAILLKLMLAKGLTPDEVEGIVAPAEKRRKK